MSKRLPDLLVALCAFTLGCYLAWHYPLGQFAASVLFVAASALAFYRLSWFLVGLPALLPLLDLAPWTGWITFEEVDLMVLSMAAGGYARAVVDQSICSSRRERGLSWVVAFSLLLGASVLISMGRGFADAGGFSFGWFQGYDGPMNSIRLGKSFCLALLLIPLFMRLFRQPQERAGHKLAWGLALGLGTASLAALWERVAFTDLLNFSSDYRSTALFWEMHVGGAALDGWLLLTAPFALWAVQHSRNLAQHALSIGLIIVASYAALTTFSRGVYLGLIVALPLLIWQLHRHSRGAATLHRTTFWGVRNWTVALFALGLMAFAVFSNGGYRGLLAFIGVVVAALRMPTALHQPSRLQFIFWVLLGVAVGGAGIILADWLPKGPYALCLILFCITIFLQGRPKREHVAGNKLFAVAGFSALSISAANVALHWGGQEALAGMLTALVVVVAMVSWAIFSAQPVWPADMRWQSTFLASGIAVCAVVAVFVGGGYIGERFSTSGKDLDSRLDHWNLSLSMLQSPLEVAFGKGLGRYPANYFYAIPENKFPGTYQITKDQDRTLLYLVAPRRPISFGDALRVSQRLDFDASGPFEAELTVRTKSGVTVTLEVCDKHLLYADGCAIGQAAIKPNNEFQSVTVPLKGRILGRGPWYAPRTKVFSVAVLDTSGVAEIDRIALTSLRGPNLLKNGDFEHEMQNWFFSSDRDHMPWHAKNILIHVILDQGVVGLVIFVVLLGVAMVRLAFTKLTDHDLAPYLLAGIAGFLVVGMFDSLIDTPRLALMFYLFLLIALLPNKSGEANRMQGIQN